MNFVINDSQLFLLLDSVFPDLSVKKVRSRNSAHTYIIESNDDEMFHYENGTLNVNPDFVKLLNRFAPIKMTDDVIVTLGKWILKKTGLKSRTIWIGLKEYNVEPHLNESFDKLRARRFMHIANDYFESLSPSDVCNYWKSEEVEDYVNETMSEMVRFITDEYPDVSAEDWHDTYDGIYGMLEGIGYSNKVRDFFYDSLDNCNLNESEEKKLKRFDRSLVKDYGKYGKKIESLALTYLKDMGNSICDLVCLCTEVNGKENYIVLIIASHYFSSNFETKLTNHITNFIPVDVWVMVNVNHHCNSSD